MNPESSPIDSFAAAHDPSEHNIRFKQGQPYAIPSEIFVNNLDGSRNPGTFYLDPDTGACVEKTANIHPTTSLGTRAIIGAGVTIANDSVLYRSVLVGEGTTIADRVRIGSNTIIGNNVDIGRKTSIKHSCIISSSVQIGTRVEIGSQSFVGSRAIVGSRRKLGQDTTVGIGEAIESFECNDHFTRQEQ